MLYGSPTWLSGPETAQGREAAADGVRLKHAARENIEAARQMGMTAVEVRNTADVEMALARAGLIRGRGPT